MRSMVNVLAALLLSASMAFAYKLWLYNDDDEFIFDGNSYPAVQPTDADYVWGTDQDTCAQYSGGYGDCFPPMFIDHTTTVHVVAGVKTSDVSASMQNGAIEDAISAWDSALDALGSDISITYYGSSTTRSLDVTDNVNTVAFGSWDGLDVGNAVTICRVSTTAGANYGEVLECDMLMNDAQYTWTDGTYECGLSQGTEKDIQSVVTHELGHLLGLGHSEETGCSPLMTMASGGVACGSCETQTENLDRRTLETDDTNGLSEIYGPGNVDGDYVKELAGYDGYPSKPVTDLQARQTAVRLDLLTTYPNPFNPETTIWIELAQGAEVSLRVYNMAGQIADELFARRHLPAGRHAFVWRPDPPGGHPAAGVYVVSLESDGWRRSHRVTLLR